MKKREIKKQIKTDRGLIWCEEAFFETANEAREHGYTFAFNDSGYGDIYSKCLDDKGLKYQFAIIIKSKRTMKEQIKFFKQIAFDYEVMAHRNTDVIKAAEQRGMAEAYNLIVFELEHNVEY